MQEDYDKYGNDYSCFLICSCDVDEFTLHLIERLCMDALNTRDELFGYNAIDKTAPLEVNDFMEVDKLGCPIGTPRRPHSTRESTVTMRAARVSAGFTLEDVAKRLRTTKQSVSKWELGESKPSDETMHRLCELYDVPMWMTTFWKVRF